MADEVLLKFDGVGAAYNGAIVALHRVDLEVRAGEIMALLGSNGAGKTTLLKAASNLLPAERGAVTAGSIRYLGRDVTGPSRIEGAQKMWTDRPGK